MSIMARKLRKTQEQLAFPELELPTGAPVLQAGLSGPFVGEGLLGVPATQQAGLDEGEADSRKAPRRRSVKPKMVLVTESLAESASDLAVPEEQGRPEPAPIRPADLPVDQPEPVASVPEPLPSSPVREAVAANEQFLAEPAPVVALTANTVEQAPLVVSSPSTGEHRLKIWAHVATIATSVVIVAALFIGSRQFIETGKNQRELLVAQKASLLQERHVQAAEINARAVELFLRYNDLMQQLNGPVAKNAKKETRYWKENLAVNLLESLFNLTRGNREWETTIAWALEKHIRFIREQRLSCTTYSPEFVRYLEKTAGARAVSLCRDLATSD
ncbi:hypothetical protein AT959_05320 [Dechloromonas denitrificans]|uniref:Uncharacterized protein n=2 Tax=Dechloromonas denitrificans TaxID=281362 RepID=A0A133XLE3_9RHOO|nr:hypothetical protein AT959_05320 [Dechloromonas denitrificans]